MSLLLIAPLVVAGTPDERGPPEHANQVFMTRFYTDESLTPDEVGDRDTVGVAEGGIGTDHLQDGAVTTEKIADGAVTTPKIADGAVTAAKIGEDCPVDDTLLSAGGGSWGCGEVWVNTAGDTMTGELTLPSAFFHDDGVNGAGEGIRATTAAGPALLFQDAGGATDIVAIDGSGVGIGGELSVSGNAEVLGGTLTLGDTGEQFLWDPANGAADDSTAFVVTDDLEVQGTLFETSSALFKEDPAPILAPLEKTLALEGVTYTWSETGERQMGLLAEQVYPVVPEVVQLDENGLPEAVAYGHLVALLIEAIQEQQAQIDLLEGQVASLGGGNDGGDAEDPDGTLLPTLTRE